MSDSANQFRGPGGAVPAGLRGSGGPDPADPTRLSTPTGRMLDRVGPSSQIQVSRTPQAWQSIASQPTTVGGMAGLCDVPRGPGVFSPTLGWMPGGVLFDIRPDGVSEARWNALESTLKANIKSLDRWIGSDGRFKPKGRADKFPFTKFDPIEEWLKVKLKEIRNILDVNRVKSGSDAASAGTFSSKRTWLDSEEGQIWYNHQVYSVMAYANASGNATAAAVDVVLMLDDFSSCRIDRAAVIQRSEQLMGTYGPKPK